MPEDCVGMHQPLRRRQLFPHRPPTAKTASSCQHTLPAAIFPASGVGNNSPNLSSPLKSPTCPRSLAAPAVNPLLRRLPRHVLNKGRQNGLPYPAHVAGLLALPCFTVTQQEGRRRGSNWRNTSPTLRRTLLPSALEQRCARTPACDQLQLLPACWDAAFHSHDRKA